MSESAAPDYLSPYLRAARRYGGAFASLLWASPRTQAARFDAMVRLCDVRGRSVLDVGCGRADLLAFFDDRRLGVSHYVGLEAVDALADVAEQRCRGRKAAQIIRADFVRHPIRLLVGADVVMISGSLNTLSPPDFTSTLHHAWQAASQTLVFNFLADPTLAARDYLTWHHREDVLALARSLGKQVSYLDDYLPGDCTIAITRADA